MIVSDSSALIALAKIERLHLLKDIFGKIVIPEEVHQETVASSQVPNSQRNQMQSAIDDGYIEVLKAAGEHIFNRMSLGTGERGVLRIALAHDPDGLIIDDRRARNEARDLGFEPRLILTSDILRLASDRGLIAYDQIMNMLREAGITLPES